jgi:hypothetical protein
MIASGNVRQGSKARWLRCALWALFAAASFAALPTSWADDTEIVVIEEPVPGTDPEQVDEGNLPTILFADHNGNLLLPRVEGGALLPAQLNQGELFYVLLQYEKDQTADGIPFILRLGDSAMQETAQKTEEPKIYRSDLYQVEAPASNATRQPGVGRLLNAATGALLTAEAEGFAADMLVNEAALRIVVRPTDSWSNRSSVPSLNTDQPFKVEVHVPRPLAKSIGETLVVRFRTRQAGSTATLRVSAAGAGARGPVVYTHTSALTLTDGGEGEGRTWTEDMVWGILPDSMLTPFTDYDMVKMHSAKSDVLVVSYESVSVEIPVYWSWRQQRLAELAQAFEGLRQLYAGALEKEGVPAAAKQKLNRKLSLVKNLDKILAVPSETLDDIRRLVIAESYFRMLQDDPDNWDMEYFGPLNFQGKRDARFDIVFTSRAEGYTLYQALEAGNREYEDRFTGFARDLTLGGYQLITQMTGTNQALMIFTSKDAMGRQVNMTERVLAGIDLVTQAAIMGASSLHAARTAREGAGGLERARLAGTVKATTGSTDAARGALRRVMNPTGNRLVPRVVVSSNEVMPENHPNYVPHASPRPRPGTRDFGGPMREVGTRVATPAGVAPVRLQESCMTCGEAAAGTAIERATGRNIPETDLVRWSDDAGRTEPGTWPREMEAVLNAHGVDTRVPFGRRFPEAGNAAIGEADIPRRLDDPGTPTIAPDPTLDTNRFTTADAERELRDGNQVLTVVNYARGRGRTEPTPHWVIVEKVGNGKVTRGGETVIDGPHVVIGDPGSGSSVAIAQDDFMLHWKRESTIIAVNPRNAGGVPLPTRPVSGSAPTPLLGTRAATAPGSNVALVGIRPLQRAVATNKLDPEFLGRVAREMDKAHYELVRGGSQRRFAAAVNAIDEEMMRARMGPGMRAMIGRRFVAAKVNGETFFGGRIDDAVERELGIERTTAEMRNEVRNASYTHPIENTKLPATRDMEADHIYPVSRIMDLPGFRDLNWRQRMAVVHWRENIQALPREFNNLKSDYLADEWNAKLKESRGRGLDPSYLNWLRQRQAELEEALARRIACLRTSASAGSCR